MQSPIRAILLLVFIAVPLLEIALLIKIGQSIGFWATILIVIATAAIGTLLLHQQGMATLRRVLDAMDKGEPPVTPVLEGLVLLVAGLLLLTPGIITDTIGFTLLIPPVRELLVRHALGRLFVVNVAGRTWRSSEGANDGSAESGWTSPGHARGTSHQPPHSGDGPVIEGEYQRLDERTVDPQKDRR